LSLAIPAAIDASASTPWIRKAHIVFTTHHSRTPRAAAGVGTLALAGALILTGPAANAAPTAHLDSHTDATFAEGQFLTGTVAGSSLDSIVSIDGAQAFNDGTEETQTVVHPLSVTALSAVTVGTGTPVTIPLSDAVELGTVAQFALADPGAAVGASGAVTSDGGLGVGSDASIPDGSATVDLQALISPAFAETVADLSLELEKIAARAERDGGESEGDYYLAGATLHFSSPAIARLTEKVNRSLDVVIDEIDDLSGHDGELLALVSALVQDLNPALNLVGTNANVSASIDSSQLRSAVSAILTSAYGDGGVSFNLETGVVSIDLEHYVGSLNNLPVNTELLTDAVISRVLHTVTDTVSGLADDVVAKVEDVIRDLTVDVHADLVVNVAQAPVVTEVCKTVERVIQVPVLGGLLGNVIGTVDKIVEELVCTEETRLLDPLTTSLVLDISATVDELVSGIGVDADITAQVLGLPINVNANLFVGAIGDLLNDRLLGDGAISDLVDALELNLVDPALDGLLDDTSSIQNLLTDVVSITVNVQETSVTGPAGTAPSDDPYFSQTAVRVGVLDGGELLSLSLASATVGPNADGADDSGCVTDCGSGGGGGGGGGGDDGSDIASLALTGVGIALLVAIILGLLIVGSALLIAHHRRTQGGAVLG
tara:strand:+ start:38106 stop:40082 length:1977 start_codon:yes stop_codon:yes gene_type:complete